MTTKTLQNTPREARAYCAYENSPLPTMEDKLLFILVYLKQAPTHDVQGALFGMYQPEAHRWIHLLHGVVNQALAAMQALPARTSAAWHATAPVADEAAYSVPKESTLYQDTGFQGLTMEGVTIKQPKKIERS